MKKNLITVLCALLTTSSPASVVPRPDRDRPLRLGVVRFEEGALKGNTVDNVAGERRLGRWLENLEQLSIHAETLPRFRQIETGIRAANCDKLQGLLHACQMAMASAEEGATPPESCTHLQTQADENAGQGLCGPDVQKKTGGGSGIRTPVRLLT